VWKSVIAAALLAACLATAAQAAKIEVDHDDCHDAQCKRIIFVSGEIVKGDADQFRRLIKSEKITNAAVFLYSPGGLVGEAVMIGWTVHELGFVTFVGKDGVCASACADIWLAGKVRYVSEQASIGFHRTSLHGKSSKAGDDLTKAYYQRLGLTEAAIRYLLSAKPDDVTWLKGDKADEIGIVFTTIQDEEKKQDEAAAKPPAPKQCNATDKFDLLSKNSLGESFTQCQ
jgi:hypothetical protein